MGIVLVVTEINITEYQNLLRNFVKIKEIIASGNLGELLYRRKQFMDANAKRAREKLLSSKSIIKGARG